MAALLTGCGDDKNGASNDSGGSGGSGSSSMSGGSGSGGKTSSKAGNSNGGSPPIVPTGDSSAADIARKLGREPTFLIGMGNDLPSDYVWENAGAYQLGVTLDLHYVYLTYGWQDWNPGGYFAQIIAEVDLEKGSTPMSTVYAMAGQGENNLSVLVDDDYMGPYWESAKLLMERYAELDAPALVHLEPDFWAYAQRQSSDPSRIPARLHPDCDGLPQDVSGMARCWFKLARENAPKVVIGLHASEWAADSGDEVGEFLVALGVAESDVVIIDILDRDAGCFEAAELPQCMRGGTFYLDESNETSPNYAERLAFAKRVSDTTQKPILWWQLPFGVPSDTPGGMPGRYRDNKVRYLFSHVAEFVEAGGVGAAFGTGSSDQTFIDSDGDQFKDAVTAYFADPVPLP